jgi:hypothetical protein
VTTERGQAAGRDSDPGLPDAAPSAAATPGDGADHGAARRNTVILRYLLGRLAIDHVRRLTRWTPAVLVIGAILLVVRPRWIGFAVIAVGVLLVAARVGAVLLLERLSLPPRFRSVENGLRDAVEAGKANLRVELRGVGLPSRSWHVPVYALRLARGAGRMRARSRLRQVDMDRVLPRAQVERALRALDEASQG